MAKEKVQENVKKFTKEEMDSISQIRNEASQIFVQLGQLHIRRRNLMTDMDKRELEMEQQHDALVQKESELYKSLNEKYGDGNLDPVSGTFTPISEEKK